MLLSQQSQIEQISRCWTFKMRVITKLILIALFSIWLISSPTFAATCSSSSSSSLAITSKQETFSGYTSTSTFNVIYGSVSGSLYYLYNLLSNSYSVLRRVNASNSLVWMVGYQFYSLAKSLSIDSSEQYLYLLTRTTPIDWLQLQASDGSFVSSQRL